MARHIHIFSTVIRGVVKYHILVLVLAFGVSLVGLNYASKLDIESDYSTLIPEEYNSVQALELVRAKVGGEGSDVAVGIISPSFEATKRFAEDLIPRAKALHRDYYPEPYLATVEYKRETEFLKQNALYFATNDELETLSTYLDDEIEKQALKANPFFIEFDDEPDDNEMEEEIEEFEDLYDWLVGKEYPVHKDGTSMTLRFFPSGSQTNITYIRNLYSDLEMLIEEMDPKSYHADLEIVLAGRLLHRVVQVEAIRNDVAKTFGLGAGSVLLLVMVYFFYKSYKARHGAEIGVKAVLIQIARLPVLAVVIGLPLIMCLSWTFGAAYLLVGNLNLMTSTLALLLFGLGIDFGVHFYGRYTEERGNGVPYSDAIEKTFLSTGKAIMIGASTTATALFILMAADFRGFSEFGLIAGLGMLFAVVAMILVQPALLVTFEKTRLLNLESITETEDPHHPKIKRFPFARTVVYSSAFIILLSVVTLPFVQFEFDFSKLDPKYPDYAAKKAIVDGASSSRMGSNPAYIVTETQAEAVMVAETIRTMLENDTTITTVKDVITLQDRFPMDAAGIEDRLARIEGIRVQLANTFLQEDDSENMQKLRKASGTSEAIHIEQVPDYLRDLFTERDGDVGTFVIIYPSVSLSDGRVSMQFARDIGTIITPDGTEYHAGSTSLVAADMLRLMILESPYMITAVFVIVIVIVLSYFGSIKWAAFALTPLIIGMFWMLFVMTLFGLKLNFFNLVVLPAMLGIGNDDGIHMVHRYQELGRGSIMKVIRTTGEQCTIGSMTTMIGFVGLLFSFHPGLRSIGEVALIGLFTTLFTALILLPAIIQFLEDKGKL